MRTTPDYDAVLAQLGLGEAKTTPAPKRDSDVPLMDMVQATTFQSNIHGTELNQNARNVLTSYRMKLRQAERFVIEDDATRLICHLSHDYDQLAAWSVLSRLPYDVFWLEFNNQARLSEFKKMDKVRPDLDMDKVVKRLGFLFYMESGSDTRWIAHEFVEDQGQALPSLLTFVFDPAGDTKYPVRRSSTWNMPTLSLREGFPKIPMQIVDPTGVKAITSVDPEFAICGLLGPRREADGTVRVPAIKVGDHIEIPDASEVLGAPEWFSARSAVIVDPFWHHHFEKRQERLNYLAASQVIEESGMLRYLITFLASVNALPRLIKPVHIRTGMQRVGLTHRVPWMLHHNLSLEIPRDDRILWARKNLNQESRTLGRRLGWHRVRYHWRVVEYGKALGRMCRHVPAMYDDEDKDLAMCDNCQMMIRWIRIPDGRGDPNISVTDKTYRVRRKKGG